MASKRAAVGVAAGLTVLAGGAVQAEIFDEAVIFGDSLSDPGNLPGLLGFDFPAPPYSENRFSNGNTYAQFLTANLGIDDANVTNPAVGGAFTGQLALPGGGTNGNITQGVPALVNTDLQNQSANYLAGSPSFSDDTLFIVYGGGNDYFFFINEVFNPAGDIAAQVDARTTETAGNLLENAELLANAGASVILLPNLSDLGVTPLYNDDPVTVDVGGRLSAGHNAKLAAGAAELAARTGAQIFIADTATLTDATIADPAKFGISNTTDACINTPACVGGDDATQDGFIFWDDVHPTRASNAVIAAFYADTLLAPLTLAAQGETSRQGAESFTRSLARQARDGLNGASGGDFRPFMAIEYDQFDRDGDRTSLGYEMEATRFTLGFDRPIAPGWRVGGAVAYETGETDLDGGKGGFDREALRLGLFAAGGVGPIEATAALQAAAEDLDDINRNTGVVGQVATSETEAVSVALQGEAAYVLGGEPLSIAPLIRIAYSHVNLDGYRETGAIGLDQIVGERTVSAITGAIGARLKAQAQLGDTILTPHVTAVYEHAFEDDGHDIITRLVTVPELPRRLETAGTDDGFARIEAGLDADLASGFRASLAADIDAGRDDGAAYRFSARLTKSF